MGILIFETDGVILEEMRGLCIFHEEQASSTLIPEGELKPGHLYSVGPSESGKLGVYKFETEMLKGNGKFTPNGIGSKKDVNEAVKIAYQYFKSNASSISGQISYKDKDYVMQVKVGMSLKIFIRLSPNPSSHLSYQTSIPFSINFKAKLSTNRSLSIES